MKKIKKALGLLCGSTVVFLLFIGTDQSAVTNIAKGIVHTAWLSVAPILRDVSTAPQLKIDPARSIQSPGEQISRPMVSPFQPLPMLTAFQL